MPLDLSDPDTYAGGMPHLEFAALRAHDPVAWNPERAGPGFWAVTRYHDAVSILRSPEIYSSWRGSVLIADPPPAFLDKLRESMMNRDPPDHTRLRRLVNKALSPRQIERLEPRIAAHARGLVASMTTRTSCDFATEVAEEMPLFMISEILGVPEEDRRALYALTMRMFSTEIVDANEAMRDKIDAAAEMRLFAHELGVRKTTRPGDDLASDLLAAEIEGRRLSDTEFQAFFMLLFNAGTDTTRSLLCHGLDLLLDRPDVVERLRSDPNALSRAIEEMLRYEPPVIQIRRTATQTVTLAGRRIAEGDKVVVFFPSANRDADVFVDPDRFDIDRAPNDHIAFGYGTHFCLGAPLARLEARHLFGELLKRLRRIERVAPIVYVRSNFVRGVRSLVIRYEAADHT
jgi:cholest-4-en-3-one 26-monooxygenase